jgi:hypothetical protein
MDAAIKAEWVAALKSGEYKQGQGALRGEDEKMCCLGVLCEIAVKHGVIPAPNKGDDYEKNYEYGPSRETAFPPAAVWRDWALMEAPDPMVPKPNPDAEGDIGLAGLNDDGYTFDQIADLIEKYL